MHTIKMTSEVHNYLILIINSNLPIRCRRVDAKQDTMSIISQNETNSQEFSNHRPFSHEFLYPLLTLALIDIVLSKQVMYYITMWGTQSLAEL